MESNKREIKPFTCDEVYLFRLAGEIIADGAANYRRGGISIKKTMRLLSLGRITPQMAKRTIGHWESVMKREQAFFMTERFLILVGVSELTGKDVLRMLNEEIEKYDPTIDIPDIDPRTKKPYSLFRWRRMIRKKVVAV